MTKILWIPSFLQISKTLYENTSKHFMCCTKVNLEYGFCFSFFLMV